MPLRVRSHSGHALTAPGAIWLLAVSFGAVAAASTADREAGPATLKRVSKSMALIRPYACNGKALTPASGFLVGESVVMTTRHALIGACRVSLTVGGTIKACWTQYTADAWDNVAFASAATSFTSAELKARGPKTYWSIVQLIEVPLRRSRV